MDFDLIIIGAGPGGRAAAEHAAALGLRTAVIEKAELGGACLNRGCMPAKALLHAAGQLAAIRASDSLGIRAADVEFDFDAVQRCKDEAVLNLRESMAQSFRTQKITVIAGCAQIVAPNAVCVGTERYTAEKLLVASGAAPACPQIPGLELPGVVTSDALLEPAGRDFGRLVIIGGGVIGVEFASIYRALGRAVTVLEAGTRLLPSMDRELSQSLAVLLKKRGVTTALGAKVERIEAVEGGLAVVYTGKQGAVCRAEGDGVLVAVGRRPCLDGLFAGALQPETLHGALVCDENFETSVKGIFAVGDVVAGNMQLAHVASAQGAAVAHQLAGKPVLTNLKCVPSCVYTDPEIASVGMTEEQAKAAWIALQVGKVPTAANGKSVIEHTERGFVKLIFRAEDEVLIGAQLMCARATDLIAAPALACANGMTRRQLLRAILPHPTFGESLAQAAQAARRR